MNKYMEMYPDKAVMNRRKLRFQHWLKHQTSHTDREVLRKIAFDALMKTCDKKSVKYTDLTFKMFEVYEDYLHGESPALKKYFDKKYGRIA